MSDCYHYNFTLPFNKLYIYKPLQMFLTAPYFNPRPLESFDLNDINFNISK